MCNVNTVCFDCSCASCPTVKQIFSLIRQSLLQVPLSPRTCPGRACLREWVRVTWGFDAEKPGVYGSIWKSTNNKSGHKLGGNYTVIVKRNKKAQTVQLLNNLASFVIDTPFYLRQTAGNRQPSFMRPSLLTYSLQSNSDCSFSCFHCWRCHYLCLIIIPQVLCKCWGKWKEQDYFNKQG